MKRNTSCWKDGNNDCNLIITLCLGNTICWRDVNELSKNVCYKKTKKCQPTARDTTDLIKTDFVPDSGLSRPKKIS